MNTIKVWYSNVGNKSGCHIVKIYGTLEAGPIAKQSKSSDLDCGQGNPGSNPGKGMCFFPGWLTKCLLASTRGNN